ncbi:MAG: hypothetical protein PPP55_10765 [Halorubrum sp.]
MTDDTTTNDTMTDGTTTNDESRRPTTDGGTDTEATDDESESGSTRFTRLTSEDLRGILDRLALAALAVLALIAGWSFYGHAGTAIRTWLDPAYQPIALAAFNLIVLFVALAGVAHQLYRIRDGGDSGDPEPDRPASSATE